MLVCPHCAAPARRFRVLRHTWLTCTGCGSATRTGHGADLADVYFRAPDPGTASRELAQIDAWLGGAGIAPRGALLDVGGGPGFAAAGLAKRPGVERVVLLEYSTAARRHAAGLGVDVRAFDFDGPAVPEVVQGPFDLVLLRYAAAWCADADRLAAGLAAVAAPGAQAVVTWALPTRGALWITAHERGAPAVLWSEARMEAAFARAGWEVAHRFEPAPPLRYPHGALRGAVALPQTLRPNRLPLELRQVHAGRVFRLAPIRHPSA